MGIPIKERGIRWKEAYGDKSAYLKEEFDKQVGPGSYFRWEGHDSTSGSDYYVVVTPGFSKKHGFHFFAALRKIPANHGASGKKFKNQAAALHHAYETWRVPPPETKPHKQYINKDLQGKAIVMENVHDAASDVFFVKTSMAVQNMGGKGVVVQNHFGPLDYAAHARHAAVMNTIADPGIGANSGKQWLLIDRKNQIAGNYEGPSGKTSSVRSGVATCEPPSEQLWGSLMGGAGQPVMNPLFSQNYKKQFAFQPPTLQEHPKYKLIRFDKLMMIRPQIVVGFAKKQQFDQQFTALASSMKSQLRPDQPIQVVNVQSPIKRSEDAGKLDVERGNYIFDVQMPVDLYMPLRQEMDKSKVASVEDLSRWEDRNAAQIYAWFQKNGDLATSEGIEKAKQTPVVEVLHLQKGQLVVYDKLGYPIGIKVQRNKHFGKETKNDAGGPSANLSEDFKFEFAPGVVERWMQQAGGSLSNLRQMLASNQIDIRREDCIDSNTCAPLNRAVYSDYPVIDENGRPQLDEQGGLKLQHRPLFEPYQNSLDSNEVRVHDPNTNKEKIITAQDYEKTYGHPIQDNQQVHGLPVVAEGTSYYMPNKDGSFKKIDARDTRLYDPASKGKIKNGAAYILIAEAERATPKKENVSKFENMEQDMYGWYGGTRKHEGGLNYVSDTSFTDKKNKRRLMNVADLSRQHRSNLYSILTPTGHLLIMPPHDLTPADPRYSEHPAIKYLSNPANVIAGYSYVGTKMYDPTPLTSNMPTSQKPVEVTWMSNKSGEFRAEIDPTTGQEKKLTITEDDMRLGKAGRKNQVYYRKFKTLMQHISAKLGLSEQEIGPFADVTDEDLYAAYDKVKEIKKKVAGGIPLEQLPPNERVYAEFQETGNEIPKSALEMLRSISPDPSKWQPRKGTLYQLKKIGSDAPIEAHPHVFVTLDKANEFKKWMETSRDTGGGGHPEGSLHIVSHSDQELVISSARATAAGKPKQIVNLPEGYNPPEPDEQNSQDPTKGPEDPTNPASPDQKQIGTQQPEEPAGVSVKAPVEIQDMPTVTAPAGPSAPAAQPSPAPGVRPWDRPAPAPVIPTAPTTSRPWDAPTAPKPAAPAPAAVPPRRVKRPLEAATIDKLVKLANKLDQQGQHAEADAIDRVIRMTVEPYSAESEEQ